MENRTAVKNKIYSISNNVIWLGRYLNNIKNNNLGNKATPNIKKSDTLVILCNGPSLHKTIEKNSFNETFDYMCVNFLPLYGDYFERFKPKYLCMIDGNYLDKNNSQYASEILKLKEKLETSPWKKIVFTYAFQSLGIIPNSYVHEYKVNCNVHEIRSMTSSEAKKYDKNTAIPSIQNVAVFALFNAIRMGYKRIYMAGVDMSFHTTVYVDENNNIIQSLEHYYGKTVRNLSESSDLIKKKGMLGFFEEWYISFSGFSLMKEYADIKQCEIVNLNPESFVDVFPKIGECNNVNTNKKTSN